MTATAPLPTPITRDLPASADAVVIGSGPNGLVAAAALADAGWDVCVIEAQDRIGGAVHSEVRHPGYVTDMFSAFYPLAAGSSIVQGLELERHGLEWVHAPAVVAHPRRPEDDDCGVIHRRPEDTAAHLDTFHPGDGAAWLRLCEHWQLVRDPILGALFTPLPPVRDLVRLLRRTGVGDALRLTRFASLPAQRMGHELFGSEQARLLLAGNALHADVPFDASGSGIFGWLLVMLAQDVGFPVPRGGAGELAHALARRAASSGAQVVVGQPVETILVRGGKVSGVRTASGRIVRVRRAVIADVTAPALYRKLLPEHVVPRRLLADLDRFEWDTPTVKVNFALDGPIPWRAKSARDAGTVHVGADERGLIQWSADLSTNDLPRHPFMLLGQMTTTDPTRSPAGTESAWAYTHLPRSLYDDASAETLAARVDEVIEEYAPGFRDRIVWREVQRPSDLTAADANLVRGAVNAGTAQLHQQLIFRPLPGLGRPETVVAGLY
ncbi:MAG: NAD(P)/FAD-dependent oxidoreductase, partial [Actinomycetota bacterium]|nr:NAD(P)/FAD-dependent oxidoreductase [Actinomycetota bacterium]